MWEGDRPLPLPCPSHATLVTSASPALASPAELMARLAQGSAL